MAISLCVQGKSYCVFLEEGLPQKVSNHFTEVKKFYAGECYKGIYYTMLTGCVGQVFMEACQR